MPEHRRLLYVTTRMLRPYSKSPVLVALIRFHLGDQQKNSVQRSDKRTAPETRKAPSFEGLPLSIYRPPKPPINFSDYKRRLNPRPLLYVQGRLPRTQPCQPKYPQFALMRHPPLLCCQTQRIQLYLPIDTVGMALLRL